MKFITLARIILCHTTMIRKSVALIFYVLLCRAGAAQLIIDNTINSTAAVQNVLLGAGVTATNITFQGNNAQIGGFTCNSCGLGLGNGVVIGTGNVNAAAGPNDTGSQDQGPPNNDDNVSDPDLADLSGMDLHNTALLEFDFVPTGDSVAFNYVFSSEEYPEFVNSINDAFAFFLSGPGINGPYSNAAMNIALIPGTNVPISINTVNAGENASYYNDNTGNAANIQADGFTTVLTAVAQVICGESYHIKIAIGDASDHLYDSWVYLEAGSFQSNQLSLEYTAPAYSSPIDGGIFEGCQAGTLAFTRTGNVDEEQIYNLTIGGNAIVGTDVTFPYTSINFPPGVAEIELSFQAIQDFVLEGMEVLELTLENTGCAAGSATLAINIYDLPALTVDVQDTTINCGGTATLTPVITGGLGGYLVEWADGFEGLSHTVVPSVATSYQFTVSDTCGVVPVTASVNVGFVTNPPLLLEVGQNIIATCLDINEIVPDIQGGFGTYSLEWYVDGALDALSPTLLHSSDASEVIELVVTDECGTEVTDALQYQVPAAPVQFELGPSWEVRCIDEVVLEPAVDGGIGAYQYSWRIDGAEVSTGATYQDFFFQSSTLQLVVNDECGNTLTDAVNVVVPNVIIDVNVGDDIVSDCLTSHDLGALVNGGSGNLSYSWTVNGGLIGNSDSTNYLATADTPIICVVEDECGNVGADDMVIAVPTVTVYLTVTPDTSICLNEGVELYANASGGTGDLIVSWEGMSNNPIAYFVPIGNSTFHCAAYDACGNRANASVTVNTEFVEPNFTSVYVDDETVGLTNLLSDSIVFFWEFSDGSISNERNPQHRFNTMGDWVATLHAYSVAGCHQEVSQTYQATGTIFIPNSFTPNGDGINDVFKPIGRDIVSYQFSILNRFGEVVFSSNNMEEYWDGGFLGGDYFVMDGSYSYILRATDARYNSIERSGNIIIVR